MIKINLLRDRLRQARRPALQPEATRVGAILAGLFALNLLFLGWLWWSLSRDLASKTQVHQRLEAEHNRLKQLEAKVIQYEKQKKELEARIEVIEQLKRNQTGPVDLLNKLLESVPDYLWLTSLKQTGLVLTIEGNFLRDEALPRFISGLDSTGLFRSVDLNYFERDRSGDFTKFSLRCELAQKPKSVS